MTGKEFAVFMIKKLIIFTHYNYLQIILCSNRSTFGNNIIILEFFIHGIILIHKLYIFRSKITLMRELLLIK
ncbi:hypothetical protein GCM10022323_03120 [Asaccharospora irregularis DSM 2635]